MYTKIWDAMNNQVSETMIKRDEDGAFIPFDEGNRDYQEYKQWLTEGNEPNQADVPHAPPTIDIPPPDPFQMEQAIKELDERLTAVEEDTAALGQDAGIALKSVEARNAELKKS